MASQPSQFSSSSCLCMPLVKFSYATVHAANIGPIPWIHLASQNDLFVLIDPANTVSMAETNETPRKFKVLQDPNFHEDIDLCLLAKEAQKAIHTIQMSTEPRRQPSILVIVKPPCIAMRYPLEGDLIRRFQVRFQRQEDYYETLKILTMENVPITEAGAVQNRPMTTPQEGYAAGAPTFTVQARPPTYTQICTPRPVYEISRKYPDDQPSLGPRTSNSHSALGNFVSHITGTSRAFSASQPSGGPQGTGSGEDFRSIQSAQASSLVYNGNINAAPASAHRSTLSFDGFVPRPSTAPVSYAQGPDIGFNPSFRALQQHGEPISSGANDLARDNVNASNKSLHSSQENNDKQTRKQPGKRSKTKGEKRVATKKGDPPAAKKPRATAPRRANGSLTMSENAPVSNTRHLQQDEPATLDTQTLLEKAEAKLAARKTRSETRKTQELVVTFGDASAIINNTQHQPAPDVTADEDLSLTGSNLTGLQATETSAASAARLEEPRGFDGLPDTTHQTTEPSHSQPQNTPLPPLCNPTTTTTTPNNADITPTIPPQPSLKSLLLSNPHFSRPIPIPTSISQQHQPQPSVPIPTPTASTSHSPRPLPPPPSASTNDPAQNLLLNFNTLPESQRRIILESWMVQTLQDEAFVNLCKTLDGMWQKIFLYR